MNIYLVTRTDNWGYDDYDSMVVVAPNATSAKEFTIQTHPAECYDWTTLKNLEAELVGTTSKKQRSTILESFNAG